MGATKLIGGDLVPTFGGMIAVSPSIGTYMFSPFASFVSAGATLKGIFVVIVKTIFKE
jgi:hypothetical protein